MNEKKSGEVVKILIIEDEKMISEMYHDRFTKEGFEVHCAFDAEEGVEMLNKIKPSLIVLDILLPKESGIYFLEKLRNMDDLKDTKVIACSNYDDAVSREKAEKLGVKEYLVKTNHTPKEIVEIAKRYLEG